MSEGVLIKSKNGWIRGSTGRADLEPATYRPKVITVEGDVTAASQPQSGHESWKLRAGRLEATISKAGTAERVKTSGNAQIERFVGQTHQRLNGSEIDTTLNDGRVEALEARHSARMVLGSDQTLESPRIWTNATGSIQTNDDSVLTVGD